MMQNRNLTLTVALVLSLGLLVTACSSGGSEPSANDNDAPSTVASEPALTEVEAVDEPVVEEVEEVDSSGPVAAPVSEESAGEDEMSAEDEASGQAEAVEPVTVNMGDITPVADDNGAVVQPAPGVPDAAAKLSHIASQDLAERLEIDVTTIELVAVEEVQWNDGSLGCPQEGYMYTQAIVPGYKITLGAGGEAYTYHTDMNSQAILCVDGSPAP